MYLVGFTIEIYYDAARSYRRQFPYSYLQSHLVLPDINNVNIYILKKSHVFYGTLDSANLYSNKKKKQYFMSQRKWPILKIIFIISFLPPRVHATSRGQNVLFGTPPPPPIVPDINFFLSFYVRDLVSHPYKTNGSIKLVTCPIFRPLTFRHRASILYVGQAFRYSPENALYIFNQQIYFII